MIRNSPFAPQMPDPMKTTTLAAGCTPAPCLLIVDDDPDALAGFGRILGGEFRIIVAAGRQAVLQHIRDYKPDLVLMDAELQGPGSLDSLEICRQIKAECFSDDLPVILLAAQADTELETSALALGAADFIRKSVDASVLQARMRTQLAIKHKLNELRRMSMFDALTGIANRRAFDDALHVEWRRAMRYEHALSLLFIDVDYFKRYNDHYGHRAGDACLRRLAAVMAAGTQRAGDLAARVGGEEFAVILPHASGTQAHAFAEALRAGVRALALPHAGSAVASHVTLSIGVARLLRPCEVVVTPAPRTCRVCRHYAPCQDAPEALIELADQALYSAKRAGRNRVVSQEQELVSAAA
jgi:diguanylate cyclase (GGDEF)-like protein